MRMTVSQPAGAGERFAAGAFAAQVGKTVPVRTEAHGVVDGKVLAADVAEDGQSVELTLDVDLQPGVLGPLGPMSFGFSREA